MTAEQILKAAHELLEMMRKYKGPERDEHEYLRLRASLVRFIQGKKE